MQNDVILLTVSGFILLLLAAFVVWLRHKFKFWQKQGEKLSVESGYITPYVPFLARVLLWLLTRTAGRLFLGPITVSGGKYLRKGRYIICPNHQFEHDAIVMSYLSGVRPWRFMAAIDQVRGKRAPWMAMLGIIPVDHANRKAKVASITSAVNALVSEAGSSFIIFPQGKLVKENQLLRADYNTGAIIIASRASEATGDAFSLLPVYIEYVTDPACATILQRILAFCGAKREFCGRAVYACSVRIGESLPVVVDVHKDELVDGLYAATVALQNLEKP